MRDMGPWVQQLLLVGIAYIFASAAGQGTTQNCEHQLVSISGAIDTTCCQPASNCVAGVPQACSPECAAEFAPFYRQCQSFMAERLPQLVAFGAKCAERIAAPSQPGSNGPVPFCSTIFYHEDGDPCSDDACTYRRDSHDGYAYMGGGCCDGCSAGICQACVPDAVTTEALGHACVEELIGMNDAMNDVCCIGEDDCNEAGTPLHCSRVCSQVFVSLA